MIAPENSFYVTGGTLPTSAPSYVEREADCDLYEGLMRGEFCYVLTSRQMGKSSLMVRTRSRLRQEGVAVVSLDLTAIGQNLTAEQWYGGLLGQVGESLDLEGELEQFWQEHQRLGPLQRWMRALRQLVLARCPGRVVVFVDEIDAVRSLKFSTDEFFAAIRECYNRRSEEPELSRLTFCLLGVASPSDLIQDTRTTPFNIGRRIELTDFTTAEAAPLARGLVPGGEALSDISPRKRESGESAKGTDGESDGAQAVPSPRSPFAFPPLSRFRGKTVGEAAGTNRALPAALLQRVLYWTGGHPYLTQRLCQAIAAANGAGQDPAAGIETPQSVDGLCEGLFLSHGAEGGTTTCCPCGSGC